MSSSTQSYGAATPAALSAVAEHSYRKTKWLSRNCVFQQKPQLLRNFQQRLLDGTLDEFGELENGIHPETLHVDRVIAQKTSLKGYQYLTKWCGLPYSESTWESEADLKGDKVGSICRSLGTYRVSCCSMRSFLSSIQNLLIDLMPPKLPNHTCVPIS